MIRQFTANINDREGIDNMISTAVESSKKGETVYLMSNGDFLQLAHDGFREELQDEGYFTAMIFEYGHRVEA